MKKLFFLISLLAICFAGNLMAQDEEVDLTDFVDNYQNSGVVIVKHGNNLISYEINGGAMTVQVYKNKGSDLKTLKSMNIPSDILPLFANKNYIYYPDNYGFYRILQVEANRNNELRRNYEIQSMELEAKTAALYEAEQSSNSWVWILGVALVIFIIVFVNLEFKLTRKNDRIDNLKAAINKNESDLRETEKDYDGLYKREAIISDELQRTKNLAFQYEDNLISLTSKFRSIIKDKSEIDADSLKLKLMTVMMEFSADISKFKKAREAARHLRTKTTDEPELSGTENSPNVEEDKG